MYVCMYVFKSVCMYAHALLNVLYMYGKGTVFGCTATDLATLELSHSESASA